MCGCIILISLVLILENNFQTRAVFENFYDLCSCLLYAIACIFVPVNKKNVV